MTDERGRAAERDDQGSASCTGRVASDIDNEVK